MKTFDLKFGAKKTILALGAESAGNFSVFHKEKLYFSEDFGDLLENTNFEKFKTELNKLLKQSKIRPEIILTDLHPLYKTTILGQKLSKKFKAKHIQIQHHIAHIFSAIGDKLLNGNFGFRISDFGFRNAVEIALDGTGYGLDGKVWGGEIFEVKSQTLPAGRQESKVKSINRIGHLENQILIGGDLAIQEPARILLSVLSQFLDKKLVYKFTKKYYSKNEFELLYNQLQMNFNCMETSSAGRVLDAVSILLGFASNKRNYKHEPIDLLEKNSTKPYADLKPKIIHDKKEKLYILKTTPLFEYSIKNINKNKKRLAATAQLYIAEGLYKIIQQCHPEIDSGSNLNSASPQSVRFRIKSGMTDQTIFLAGGIANNKIISTYFESKGAYKNKTVPVGDAGLSFGQIIYYLLADSRD
jgi:hydrogenase maturation protein HypF